MALPGIDPCPTFASVSPIELSKQAARIVETADNVAFLVKRVNTSLVERLDQSSDIDHGKAGPIEELGLLVVGR